MTQPQCTCHLFRTGKQQKAGYLLRYKREWLRKRWKEQWVVLYEDSTLAWYKDKDSRYPLGFVKISDAPELLAASEWTTNVPYQPTLPMHCDWSRLIAVGSSRQKIHWFLAQSRHEVNKWMDVVKNTLPAPPLFDSHKEHGVALLQQLLTHNGVNRNANQLASNKHQRDINHDDYSLIAMVAMLLNWGHGIGWSEALSRTTSHFEAVVAQPSLIGDVNYESTNGGHHHGHSSCVVSDDSNHVAAYDYDLVGGCLDFNF